MSQRPFRFIHASDFHLERPFHGLAEVPDHLREPLIDAPYRAAERVFESALAENADFVVLSGDLMQIETAGPRGLLFLTGQFERLRERGIHVYWAGGRVDPPEAWPVAVPLPDNVRLFSRRRPEDIVHRRDGEALVRLTGLSRQRGRKLHVRDFWPDAADLFSIAVAYGTAQREALAERGIHYWALGGAHRRDTWLDAASVAHYPGTTQGRNPKESGPRGCTLVDVDAEGHPRLRLIPTDALRWRRERVAVGSDAGRDELRQALFERMHTLVRTAPGRDWLVSWTIGGTGPLISQLRRGRLAAELLAELRAEFGRGSPWAWSLSLEAAADVAVPISCYEQDTILGEFLRTVRGLESGAADSDASLDLAALLRGQPGADMLAGVLRTDAGPMRGRVLRRVASLGADLLSLEEPRP